MTMHPARVRFGVIGMNHDHINGMTSELLEAGAELVGFYAAEDDLAARYAARFDGSRWLPTIPAAPLARYRQRTGCD